MALIGYFGEGNFGNEASLAAVLQSLSDMSIPIKTTCFCHVPERFEPIQGIDVMPFLAPHRNQSNRVRKVIAKVSDVAWVMRWVRANDVIVVPGTGILESSYAQDTGALKQLVVVAVAARIYRRRLALLAIGADQFSDPTARRMIKFIGSSADYFTVRDDQSAESIASMSGGVRPTVDPDVVMGASGIPARRPIGGRVIIGTMAWRPNGLPSLTEGYMRKMRLLIESVMDRGMEVDLVGGDDDDLIIARNLATHVAATRPQGAKGSVSVHDVKTMDGVRDLIAQSEISICTRFHNLVAAVQVGVPVISIEYARKNSELMSRFGLAEYCHRIEDFDVGAIIAQVDHMIENQEAISQDLEAGMVEIKSEADRAASRFRNFMVGSPV